MKCFFHKNYLREIRVKLREILWIRQTRREIPWNFVKFIFMFFDKFRNSRISRNFTKFHGISRCHWNMSSTTLQTWLSTNSQSFGSRPLLVGSFGCLWWHGPWQSCLVLFGKSFLRGNRCGFEIMGLCGSYKCSFWVVIFYSNEAPLGFDENQELQQVLRQVADVRRSVKQPSNLAHGYTPFGYEHFILNIPYRI